MKIGILTLPPYSNYGGILQAWALKTVLEGMGHDVCIFIHKKSQTHNSIIMPLVWLKRLIGKITRQSNITIFSEIYEKKKINRKYGKIFKFVKHNLNCKAIESISEISSNNFDTIIVGSDQIWRKEYIIYLWGFEEITEAFLYGSSRDLRKFAYGASFGVDSWDYNEGETDKIKEALNLFSAISVRENSGVKLLRDNTGIHADWVLDPTMLIDRHEYIRLFDIKPKNEQKNIVTYILDPTPEKGNIIEIVKSVKSIDSTEINRIPAISLKEWICNFESANIIITDSFHGCVFAIIFGKPLILIPNIARGYARFETLVSKFGLHRNIAISSMSIDLNFDYHLPANTFERLNQYREESFSFISKILK